MKKLLDLNKTLDSDYVTLLQQHYNIISIVETTEFDCGNSQYLIDLLESTKKEIYNNNDRYVIVHFDTDFYWKGHGINLNNLFAIWQELNIPLYTMIYFTNHIGISKEIEVLVKNHHPNDRPTVIESIVNRLNYNPNGYKNFETNISSIEKHALCMLAGTHRSHRLATYNQLKDLVPDFIEMTLKKST